MPERQVPGLASHGDDEIPPRRGLRVHHQVLHDVGAEMARGLESERVHERGQIEIVVDGLRHVDDVDAARRALFDLHRGIGGIVAADRDELRHVEPQQ